ncbi:type I-E CRISPR-associated protein Cas5/CasD [Coraliomargarita algicola]|uniref:Type I-E CRISPR-associated protein Cas5/CasD n=1 Tax=Coraliomargarita algicola TaxID=3092156 RepID=A0ABZ0RLK9_9BACT|nr:type I-E CRISPR-associated protein Cas5/CasD [Coraliomargarita sp. J2-16]WPJ95660.1 type I-E CRISPR-associated protein Cas5/CasD [Coraliomargarita sp. J2-16]
MPALAFYIDAPLQSWGASSKFQYRETNAFPTKSALIGLIAGALGIDKNLSSEANLLRPIADLKLTVVRLNKQLTQRAISPTRFTDFHTVGGGYTPLNERDQTSWQAMMCNHKASGGIKKTKGTPDGVITRRSYLTDARFAALLEGDAAILSQVQAALLDPVWGVWFGRKTCLPASPLTPTLGADRQAAFDQLLDALPAMTSAPLESFEYQEELDANPDQDGAFYQSDQPIAFGQHHGAVPAAYQARGIRHHRPATD